MADLGSQLRKVIEAKSEECGKPGLPRSGEKYSMQMTARMSLLSLAFTGIERKPGWLDHGQWKRID